MGSAGPGGTRVRGGQPITVRSSVWRANFVAVRRDEAEHLGAAGVLIAWAALPRGDSGGEEKSQPLLDFRPVLANRDVPALMVGTERA
jgi:hypothetical protein